MRAPIFPDDEVYRLEALRSLNLLDTAPDSVFDDLVHIGRALFDVPICLISLIDSSRQWFKARAGLDAQATERCISFCGHAILGRDVFVVPDALQDERFHDNPLVTGGPCIRFYAGAPLWLPSDYPIGTLCIISPEPRGNFDAKEAERLSMLAGLVLEAITVRALRSDLDTTRAKADDFWSVLRGLPHPIALLDALGRVEACNRAFAALCPLKPPDGFGLTEALTIPDHTWSPAWMNAARVDACDIALPDNGTVLQIRRRANGFVVTEK